MKKCLEKSEKETMRFLEKHQRAYNEGLIGGMKRALGDLEIRPPKKHKL